MAERPRISLAKYCDHVRYVPHEAQLAVHTHPARYRICAWGTRAGKTICAANELMMAALEPGDFRVCWTASASYGLADKVFRAFRMIAQKHFADRIMRERWSDMHVEIQNLSGGITEVRGKSTDNHVSLLGEGVDFLVVDEFSRVDPIAWHDALAQRLIDTNGRLLGISSPDGFGLFYDLYQRGQEPAFPDWMSWQFPSSVNPHLPEGFLEEQRAGLPASFFRQNILAEFVDGEGAVFSAANIDELATLPWPSSRGIEPEKGNAYAPTPRYYAGVDLAGSGADWTVVLVTDSARRVVYMDRFRKLPWPDQVARIVRTLRRYNGASAIVDATGLGQPIVGQLAEAGANVKPFVLTVESKKTVINDLVSHMERGLVTLPRIGHAPSLIQELKAYSQRRQPGGGMRYSAPSGQHDDAVIALALAVHGNRSSAPARVRMQAVDLHQRPPAMADNTPAGLRAASTAARSRMDYGERMRSIFRY